MYKIEYSLAWKLEKPIRLYHCIFN